MLVSICKYWIHVYIISQCEIKFKATIIGDLCLLDNNKSHFKTFSLKLNSNFQISLYMPVYERDYAIESHTKSKYVTMEFQLSPYHFCPVYLEIAEYPLLW